MKFIPDTDIRQYTAAAKQSALDPVSKALSSLRSVFARDAKLSPMLHAPTLSATDKRGIIAELEKHTGGAAAADKSGTLKNFLGMLAENNRLGLLEGVCEKFERLMEAHRGEMEVVVTSAQRLEERVVKRLEQAVAKSELSRGRKMKVVTKVCLFFLLFLVFLGEDGLILDEMGIVGC